MGRGAADGAWEPLRPIDELRAHLDGVMGCSVDPAELGRALTHRSYAYERGGLPHNERLEFLGDSVLGLVVTATLYTQHPDTSEGQLAKLRAAVVNMRALATAGRTLSLGDYLLLGRGEEASAQLGAALDWKTSLQEISARHSLGLPEYAIEEDGPEHAKIFAANVRVGETVRGTGVGRTKKVAEQEAAANAWAQIRAEFGEDG